MISKTYTFWGVVRYATWFLLFSFVFIFFPELERLGDVLLLLLAIGILLFYAKTRNNIELIKERPQKVLNLTEKYGFQYESTSDLLVTANLRELGKKDVKFENCIKGDGWQYADYSYAIYRKTKHGSYKSETVHYSILEIKLPRHLPNMLFDSPKTHRRQFRKLFDRSQVHRLEGSFDEHFTTYFPPYYSIDALSIITPEVMQAMIDADSFDIEISGDRLYLYRPLMPVNDIPGLIQKGMSIKEKLMNNIETYRDERLDFADGRKGVSTYGHQLLYNPFRSWPALLVGAGMLAFGIYSYSLGAPIYNEGIGYGVLIIGFTAWDMGKAWHKNRVIRQSYQKYMLRSKERSEKLA